MGSGALTEQDKQLTENFLVDDSRGGHIIEDTVDQFDAALVRQGIIVIESVFAVFLFCLGLRCV